MLRWSAAFARGQVASETSNYSYIKPKGEIAGAAGVMPEAMPPIWKISITDGTAAQR